MGLNPAGIFFCLGITNIILGIKFNLPLPVEPQKTIGAVAISNQWTPLRVYSTGFATGIIWAIAGTSKKINHLVKKIPKVIVRSIQMGLAFLLSWMSFKLIIDNILLSSIAFGIIIISIKIEKLLGLLKSFSLLQM